MHALRLCAPGPTLNGVFNRPEDTLAGVVLPGQRLAKFGEFWASVMLNARHG